MDLDKMAHEHAKLMDFMRRFEPLLTEAEKRKSEYEAQMAKVRLEDSAEMP